MEISLSYRALGRSIRLLLVLGEVFIVGWYNEEQELIVPDIRKIAIREITFFVISEKRRGNEQ